MKKLQLRTLIQITIIIIIISLALIHQKFGIEKAAPIDAYCPFGAVESFFTLIFKGEFLKRIFTSSFILITIFIVANLFLGRVFCSYICPLGAIQEWLRKLGKKLGFKKDLEVPKKIDKYLRYIKYIILAIIVYFSFYLGDLVFRHYDPFTAFMHFGQEFEEKFIGYLILGLIIIGALFSKSLWCRYFCPLGAFFGIINKFSFFKIKRNSKTCISCSICDKQCPAKLNIQAVKEIKNSDCISCSKCIKDCPKNSLSHTVFNKKISKKAFTLLVIILVIIPLIVTPFTPFWKTKPESNILNSKGEININNIRGSNTLEYIIKTTAIPFEEFQTKLNLPENVDLHLKLKLIGKKYNIKNGEGKIIETTDFREIVSNYKKNKTPEPKATCPFGEKTCEFPGKCGRYIDQDENKVCDLSE